MTLFYEFVIMAFIFSILGWIMEVTLKFIQYHRFINRGFLIGPYCPIYGFGVVGVTILVGGLIGREGTYAETFMAGIRKAVTDLVEENHDISEEQRAIFGVEDGYYLGKCPRCGCDVIKGKYGAYCTKKCGMRFGKAMGKELSEEQIKKVLKGERILVKDIKSKKGKTFDAYLTPKGISNFSYTDKDGQEISGFQSAGTAAVETSIVPRFAS